jgi:hypothetical protein
VSFCRRLQVVGAGSIHDICNIPSEAVLLEGAKAVATLGLQWDVSLEFWIDQRANPTHSFAGMQCYGGTGRGSSIFALGDFGYFGHLCIGNLRLRWRCNLWRCRRRCLCWSSALDRRRSALGRRRNSFLQRS